MIRKVCVSFDQDLCFVAQTEKLDAVESVPVQHLSQTIKAMKAVGLEARGVLGSQDYQLIRAKKPAVPESGMKEALLWQEQAHFAMPAHQLILEYRECRVVSGLPMVYITAVSKPALQSRYDALQAAGLVVTNLTTPEFVYAEYIQAHYPKANLVMWVNISHQRAQALAYLKGDLVATIRLPTTNEAEQARSLQQFYESQLTGFEQEPLWLLHHETPVENMRLPGKMSRLAFASLAYYGGGTFV